MPDQLLTVEQIAEFLQVSPKTVYRLLRRGEIPAYRIANQWRFNRAKINRWLASQSTDADDESAA